jgi:hypothetical protein
MSMSAVLQYSTEAGDSVNQEQVHLNLLDSEGTPRFTMEEYKSIKQAMYRMILADGLIKGEAF